MTGLVPRLIGVLLFLPVPFVLWCLTRQPFGVAVSLAVAALLLITHRLYARPWALSWGRRRCLWCGRHATEGPLLITEEGDPAGTVWRTCCGDHETRARRFLGWASRWRLPLRFGILGALLLLFVGVGATAIAAPPWQAADAVAVFELLIALLVLPVGALGPYFGERRKDPIAVPFPLHIQALIGTWAVSWLLRLVGVAWLVMAGLHFAQRLGLS